MAKRRPRVSFLNAALTAVILSMAPAGFSQTSDHAPPRLLDRYSSPEPSCQLARTLDYLADALIAYEDDIAYVIVYRTYNSYTSSAPRQNLPGMFQRHSRVVKNYLVKEKHFADDRVQIIDGGIIEGGMPDHFQAEVWLVPKGQPPPLPDEHARPFIQQTNQRRLFDEYSYNPDNNMAEYFDPVARLEGFAKTLGSEPNAVGYIIGYGKSLDINEWRLVDGTNEYVTREYQQSDSEGTGKEIAMAERSSLLELFGIDQSRVWVIDGGYISSQMVELWIVPTGGVAPKATPTKAN